MTLLLLVLIVLVIAVAIFGVDVRTAILLALVACLVAWAWPNLTPR